MDKLLTDIIHALRENPRLDAAATERLMRLHNGRVKKTAEDPRPFTKRRLMPHFLRVPEENPQLWAAWDLNGEEIAAVTALLQVKPRRTQSGVATITLITAPAPCRGNCIFCPTEEGMPKSYLSDEPACQRAVQSEFDPYLQVTRRLRALREMGHPTDKVEFIILGGTWDDYPASYRVHFVSEAFRALNEFAAKSEEPAVGNIAAPDADDGFATLFALQRANENAGCRCVGLVVETRPDCITPASLTFARALGATKIQMGVQSLDEDILAQNGRPISQDTIARAFSLLRLFGFKSHVHVMLNLLGSTPEADVAGYRTLMEDPRFRPDEVKLYPCMLITGAKLETAWREGRWVPYTHEELTDALADCLVLTRPWTRVSRMIRDFSAQDIVAGDKTANLRQKVEQLAATRAAQAGTELQEMRAREIVRGVVAINDLHLDEVRYQTATGEEVFLQWVTPENKLAGFLRLSLPAADLPDELTAGTPYSPGRAVIREVHVYGRTAQIGAGEQNAQHRGLGSALIRRAEELARAAGYTRLAVISAVGTREYYARLGFGDPTADAAADTPAGAMTPATSGTTTAALASTATESLPALSLRPCDLYQEKPL